MQVRGKSEDSDTIIPTGGGTNTCGLAIAAQDAVTTLLEGSKHNLKGFPMINTCAVTQ